MIAILLLTLVTALGPQQKPAPAKQPAAKRAVKPPCPKASDADVCARGWQLLEAVEAETSAIQEPGMRAYALVQLARPYAPWQKNKAVSLLNDAFRATLIMPDDRTEKSMSQARALTALAP